MRNTIYDMAEDYLSLYEKLTELESEESEEAYKEAVTESLKLVILDIKEKADDYYRVMAQLKAEAEAVKAEKLRLAKKQATKERNIEAMREMLRNAMLLMGVPKIKGALATFSTQTRWKVFLDRDPDEIPKEFQKIKIEANMTEIEKWLKADQGRNAQECEWAHLDQVETLTVR